MEAVVERIAADGKSLSATSESGRAEYRLAPDAQVSVDGKDERIGNLKPGMTCTLRLSAVHPVIFSLTAIGPKLEGVVRSVDTERKTLTVLLRSPRLVVGGMSADGAVITVGGKVGTLGDLKPGMRVQVQWAADPDTGRVLAVRELNDGSK